MRKLGGILLSILLFSCNIDDKRDPSLSQVSELKDSLVIVSADLKDVKNNKSASILKDSAEITHLPLLAHFGYSNMSTLVREKSKLYKLPLIKKIHYVHTDSSRGTVCHSLEPKDADMPIDSIFSFKTYRYRLPNIYNYESYLVCDTLPTVYNKTKEYFIRCHAFMFASFGYLILYDTLSGNAKVIALQYWNSPSGRRRTFDIDKNYEIHLCDYFISEDPDEGGEYLELTYTIIILPKGEIKVKRNVKV